MKQLTAGLAALLAIGVVGASPLQAQDQDRQRQRIHATEAQRQQLRDCAAAAERFRERAREMLAGLEDPTLLAERARPYRDRLRLEFQALQGRHERLVAGLASRQRDQIRERLAELDRLREAVRQRLRLVDEGCDGPAWDRLRLRDHVQAVEQAAERICLQYRELGLS